MFQLFWSRANDRMIGRLEHWTLNAAVRSRDMLRRHVGTILNRFTPEERASYFTKADHASVQVRIAPADAPAARGIRAHLVGGADVATELDAKRAIDQASRLAALI